MDTPKATDPLALLLDDKLFLLARLAHAMHKAGRDAGQLKVVPGTYAGSHDDMACIVVSQKTPPGVGDEDLAERGAEWLLKALTAGGVKKTRSGGSWGRGINVIGAPTLMNSCPGEHRIVVHVSSIGELRTFRPPFPATSFSIQCKVLRPPDRIEPR